MNLEELIKKNVAKPNFDELAAVMALDSEQFKLTELTKVCAKIFAGQSRYQSIEKVTGVPWHFIGCLHFMEASLRWEACLHNGEPWNKKTTIVPKGRGPWASFEEAAIDALKYDKLADKPQGYWTIARMLAFAESYNGTGYRKRGILSPYVFAYTNLSDEMGKYVADHVYDATKPHNRPSVGAILLMLKKMEETMETKLNAPWVKWFDDRIGWTEFTHDKELSKGWKYTNVPSYKTVIGSNYAWCAMALCTALEENGYKGTKNAAAKSFVSLGLPCELVDGAIVVIKHTSGRHHVTLFNGWFNKEKKLMLGKGANQSNAVNVTKFNVSGNKNGCDEIIAIRWPVRK